jgi:site-specific DNA-methyltransferase (adenine-specific)
MARNVTTSDMKSGRWSEFTQPKSPIRLYEWLLLNYAKEGDKILDTHGGSLSIALAVHNVNTQNKMNLTLDVCELDKDYYLAGKERLRKHQQQLTIF